MTKLEIVARERRSDGTVLLYPEGMFYKAYEQSAFILCTKVHPFKVSVRELKGMDGPLVSVGFPQSSLSRWTAESSIEPYGDGVMAVHLPGNIDLSGFPEWKSGLEPKAAASREKPTPDRSIPVYGATYRLTVDVTQLCARLERTYRYSLGEELRGSLMKALLDITFASDKEQRLARIRSAREAVEEAQLCLRLLNDLKAITDKRYVPFIDATEDIKKQLAAWERAEHSTRNAGVQAP